MGTVDYPDSERSITRGVSVVSSTTDWSDTDSIRSQFMEVIRQVDQIQYKETKKEKNDRKSLARHKANMCVINHPKPKRIQIVSRPRHRICY